MSDKLEIYSDFKWLFIDIPKNQRKWVKEKPTFIKASSLYH